jgi:hypothetical protein
MDMSDTTREHNNQTAPTLAESLARLEQELAQGRARLAAQRTRRQEALREVKIARGVASDLSWELADMEQRLRDLQEQREGPGDPLLERELTSIAGQRAALEERVLAQMLLVDDLVARADAEEQALAAEEQLWAAREPALMAERVRIAAELAVSHNRDETQQH